MEPDKDGKKVNIDCNNNIICQNPELVDSESAENNPPIDENDIELVAMSHKDAADLNKPHTIPLVTLWTLISLVYPILRHVFDLVSDIRLTIDYFENQKTGNGSLTLAFTILQAIAAAWISFLMHNPKWVELSTEEQDEKTEGNYFKKIAKRVAQNSVTIIFQHALPLCHLRKFYFAWRTGESQRKGNEDLQNHYHRKMLEEDRDSAVHEVVECFVQSAPQFILQLYILFTQDTAISEPMWFKIVSGCLTLYTLGNAMKNYHCAIRLAQPDRAVISEKGAALVFVWHFGTITARVLLIGVASSNWLLYTSLACLVNWIGWTAWIYSTENVVSILHGRNSDFYSTSQTAKEKIRNLFLAGVLGTIHMFTFVSLRKENTFIRNSVFYILCLLQNGTVLALLFVHTNLTIENDWFSKDLFIITVIFYFATGIAAMIIYYLFFHPSVQSRSIEIEVLVSV